MKQKEQEQKVADRKWVEEFKMKQKQQKLAEQEQKVADRKWVEEFKKAVEGLEEEKSQRLINEGTLMAEKSKKLQQAFYRNMQELEKKIKDEKAEEGMKELKKLMEQMEEDSVARRNEFLNAFSRYDAWEKKDFAEGFND